MLLNIRIDARGASKFQLLCRQEIRCSCIAQNMNNQKWKQLPASLKLFSVVWSWCEFKTWKMHNGNQELSCEKIIELWTIQTMDFGFCAFSFWGEPWFLVRRMSWSATWNSVNLHQHCRVIPLLQIWKWTQRNLTHLQAESRPSTMSLSASIGLGRMSWIYRPSRPLWGHYRTCKNCVECILLRQGVCYIEEI